MQLILGSVLLIGSVALVWAARSRDGVRVSWLTSDRAEVGVGMLFTGGSMLGLILMASSLLP